jgi:hypothetical protein
MYYDLYFLEQKNNTYRTAIVQVVRVQERRIDSSYVGYSLKVGRNNGRGQVRDPTEKEGNDQQNIAAYFNVAKCFMTLHSAA